MAKKKSDFTEESAQKDNAEEAVNVPQAIDDVLHSPSTPEVDKEVIQKENYERWKKKLSVDIQRQAESAATSIQLHSNENLLVLAKTYNKTPFNYLPQTADAVKEELLKRGFDKEAEAFVQLLDTMYWYKKPWLLF